MSQRTDPIIAAKCISQAKHSLSLEILLGSVAGRIDTRPLGTGFPGLTVQTAVGVGEIQMGNRDTLLLEIAMLAAWHRYRDSAPEEHPRNDLV